MWVITLCLTLVANAQPQMEARSFESLQYRIYVPEGLKTDQRVPLVLFLHGAGERGDDNTAQLKHGVYGAMGIAAGRVGFNQNAMLIEGKRIAQFGKG